MAQLPVTASKFGQDSVDYIIEATLKSANVEAMGEHVTDLSLIHI